MTLTEQYVFDEAAASKVVNFFERLLVHTKGEWAGQKFGLLDWQKNDVIRPLFGWKRANGTRKYRRAYIEVPKKQGKSALCSGIALYLLFADDEPGAEVYSAAADRDQAAIVFDVAKQMVENSPQLHKRAEVFRRAITVPSTYSKYHVLSADAFTKHGLNPSGIIFDELHTQPNRDLWDTLTTGMGARRQPLLVSITTAGFDRQSICYEQHEYARQILGGVIDDPTFFAYIAAADQADDWTDPKIWAKANPSLGVTVQQEFLEVECNRAKQSPAYQNTFRRLFLNQWTSQETRYIPMDAWRACAGQVDAAELAGRPCYGGLDLASTTDIAAFVLVFPPEEDEPYQVLPFFWVPAENIIERARRDRVPYDAWARDGLITATPGNVIDYSTIAAAIENLGEVYNIREIAFDRWGAIQMSQQLEALGYSLFPMGQGIVSMSPPTKELLRLILSGKIAHGGNPVLTWMADNVMVTQDAAGNVKPDKSKSRERIDGVVATIMSLDRAQRNLNGVSVYEDRDLLVL